MNLWNLVRHLGHDRRRQRKTRTVTRARLQLEVLEDRTLPDGNASGTIIGTVFIDHNGTGTFDPGDITVSGAQVTLTGTTNLQGSVNTTATTDASGTFTFQNVLPGTYELSAGPLPFLIGGSAHFTVGSASPDVDVASALAVNGGQTIRQDLGFLGLAPQFISNKLFLASTTTADLPFPTAGPGASAVNFRPNSAPTVSTPIGSVAVAENGADTQIDLAGHFTDPDFTNSQVTFNTTNGLIHVTLFDTTAPQTVANFFDYVNSGAYNNAIFSRLVSGFVLQGGGATLTTSPSGSNLNLIPTNPTVPNEFSASNTFGTLAMAQSAGNPNSATDQFFFNLANNGGSPNNLDASKFTVFGQVTSQADQFVLDTIAGTPVKNESGRPIAAQLPSVDLSNVPLNNYTGTNFPTDATASNFVVINSISIDKRDEFLTYSVVSNSNAGLVTASISNEHLTLHYAAGQTGTATITVRATDRFGATVDQTFSVKVIPLTIDTVTNPVNSANQANASASGTTAAGNTVSVTATDGTTTTTPVAATVDAAGNWTATGINLTSLHDGTITYTVTVTDAFGASGSLTKTATKDTVAPAVSVLTVTDPITADNQANTSASGTVSIGSTVSVTASDGTTTTAPVAATVDQALGTWTATGIDVSGLNDGTITYTATATDTVGNTATASKTATKST
jgi:cyclophilin family peptidyl-prolyl cis-trans isomerase